MTVASRFGSSVFVSGLFAAAAQAAEPGGHGEALPFWQDTTFWVSLGMFAVIALFLRMGVFTSLGKALDGRSVKIAAELEEARRLREEAQETLARYQRRARDAEEEAGAIVDQARRDAKQLAEDMRAKIDAEIARRARAAEDKIARAEAQAVAEIRNRTVDVAIAAATDVIRERMDASAQTALAEKAVDDLRARLH